MRKKRRQIRADLLDNALDNIKLVTTNNDLLALVQSAKGVQFGLDSRTENISSDACRVDTDGAIVHGGNMTLDVNTSLIGGGLVTANSNTRRDEVTRVGISLEADEIRGEHSIENFLST